MANPASSSPSCMFVRATYSEKEGTTARCKKETRCHLRGDVGRLLSCSAGWKYLARVVGLCVCMDPQLERFADTLALAGIDITQPFDVRWYNAHAIEHSLPLSPLPTFERPPSDGTLAVLLGNSTALWPAFLRWLAAQPDPESVTDPLDTYTASVISAAVADLTGGARHDIFWVTDSSRLVSMQRVALVSGLCYHDAETQLSIHPAFGAWVAFRAVVVLDAPAARFGDSPPPLVRCLLTDADKASARDAMAAALRASDEANLCTQLHGARLHTRKPRERRRTH